MNAHTVNGTGLSAIAIEIEIEIETHLPTIRSLVRAIMMSSEEITHDERDNLMLTDLTFAIGDRLKAIEQAVGLTAA